MANIKESRNGTIWPYSRKTALACVPLIFLGFGIIFWYTHLHLGWPNGQSSNTVLLLVVCIAIVPVLLTAFDYLAGTRGKVDIKGISIDFSRALLIQSAIDLPPNMFQRGIPVSESSIMEIAKILDSAGEKRITRIDLKDGDEWWASRLLVLCAGAVRTGAPEAIVFVGQQKQTDEHFLGWADPTALLKALLASDSKFGYASVTYGGVYDRARKIAMQIAMFAPPPAVLKTLWTYPALGPDVTPYLQDQSKILKGEVAVERILLDELEHFNVEVQPDRLTIGRLEDLVGNLLCRESIDLDDEKEKQVRQILDCKETYIAAVKDGKFSALVERADAQRLVLRHLLEYLE